MALCGYNALGKLDFARGTNKLTYAAALNIARLSYRGGNAYCARVRKGKLNLICRARGA